MQFEIQLEGQSVGIAEIERVGQSLRICCFCELAPEDRYEVHMRTDRGEHNLGLCVPYEHGIGLTARLPAKQLGEHKPSFWAVSREAVQNGDLEALRRDQPFAKIKELDSARIVVKNRQLYVAFTSN